MTENQLPTAPATDPAHTPYAESPAPTRTWRDRLPRGRKVVAAGAVVAGLAIGGAGFGAGYAVAAATTSRPRSTTQTTDGFGDRGLPGDGRGPMGDLDGQLPGGPMGGTTQGDGSTGQAPRLRRRRPARHRHRHPERERLHPRTAEPPTDPPRTASPP